MTCGRRRAAKGLAAPGTGDGVGPRPLRKHVLRPVLVAETEVGSSIKPERVGGVLGLVLAVSGGLGAHPGSSGWVLCFGLGWASHLPPILSCFFFF